MAARDLLPILLVDDRPENLHTLEAVLGPLGFPLVTASSGERRCGCCWHMISR